MMIDRSQTGDEKNPYFIAEAGVNHNGSIETAERLVDAAVSADAHAVKFQTFDPDALVTGDAAKATYQVEATGEGSQREMLQQYALDRSAHEHLIEYCRDRGITFLSTPFDPASADMLADLGLPAIKLGSGELDNHPLLKHVASFDCPMIVSTGMSTMSEVRAAREAIHSVSTDPDLCFLHCTSAYPCGLDDVNLRAMETMDTELPEPVGYSDHTTLVETPALAVAAGAKVVEKHFTLDRSLRGPDHEASLEPDELTSAVELVKSAARARGEPEKRPVAAELQNRGVARKSLHAARDLPAGTELSRGDIWIARPADGLSPKQLEHAVGATLTEAVNRGQPLSPANTGLDPD